MSKIKLAVVGKSNLAQDKKGVIESQPNIEFVGFFDSNQDENFNEFYGISPFDNLLKKVDAIWFVGNNHRNLSWMIEKSVKFGIHIFFDGFPNIELGNFKEIYKNSEESNSILFISNTKGTSPIFATTRQYLNHINHIEVNLKLPINTDLTFKRNLLYEVFDVLLRSNFSPVLNVKAKHQKVFTQNAEKSNILIDFNNGCNANINIDSLFDYHKHTIKYFMNEKIITMNLTDNTIFETKINENKNSLFNFEDGYQMASESKEIQKIEKKIMFFDVFQKDLTNFVECINYGISPLIGFNECFEVLKLMSHIPLGKHEETF